MLILFFIAAVISIFCVKIHLHKSRLLKNIRHLPTENGLPLIGIGYRFFGKSTTGKWIIGEKLWLKVWFQATILCYAFKTVWQARNQTFPKSSATKSSYLYSRTLWNSHRSYFDIPRWYLMIIVDCMQQKHYYHPAFR